MKKNILYILLLSINLAAYSQTWGESGNCEVNANDPAYLNYLNGREGIISATVKLEVDGTCTGTLINRNTSDGAVGFYILTARHCITNIDFNIKHTLYFNYQSPSANNNSTPTANQGNYDIQSIQLSNSGYEYRHSTYLRLVNSFVWGDFALLEVLTPVPPHFNVTYSAWSPSRFYSISTAPMLPTPVVGIHHPKGDIKKISGINQIWWLETPIATGCYTVTTVIDVLFGWIWGNSVSTSVICNYVDIPWLSIPYFQYGVVEQGSSGSGVFDPGNRVIGVLSGGLSSCDVPVLEFYGKLHANYSNASIKNTLNPNHNVWVDLTGLGDRKITCYENLELPGAPGVSGEYFPANHYQAENKIILQASNNIIVNQPIHIFSGADYEFRAGNEIILGPNFHADAGANFIATISPCNSNKISVSSSVQKMFSKVNEIYLPISKTFDMNKYSNDSTKYYHKSNLVIKIFPNPCRDNFNVSISLVGNIEQFNVELTDLEGMILYKDNVSIEHQKTFEINISFLKSGMYILKIFNDNLSLNEKIVKM